MPGFSDTLTLDELARRIESAPRRINLGPALKQIRLYLIAQTKLNFIGAHDPEGNPWAPLSPSSRRRKRDKRGRAKGGTPQPLRDTGALMASVTSRANGNVERITDSSIEFGTVLDYAGYQQEGTRTIPARPFLGISKPMEQRIEEIVGAEIERQLAEVL